MQLRCFVCDKELEPVFGDATEYPQPSGGVAFTTHGNYGSTVFDPSPITRSLALVILVCDECLIDKQERVLAQTTIPETRYIHRDWNPEVDN